MKNNKTSKSVYYARAIRHTYIYVVLRLYRGWKIRRVQLPGLVCALEGRPEDTPPIHDQDRLRCQRVFAPIANITLPPAIPGACGMPTDNTVKYIYNEWQGFQAEALFDCA
jgi:hypothetical protein